MNKQIKYTLLACTALSFCVACGNGNPHVKGLAAGKEACECYKLEDQEKINACLDKIELENQEYIHDTSFTNAMESVMLECISDGVIDIVKPIKEYAEPQEEADSTATADSLAM